LGHPFWSDGILSDRAKFSRPKLVGFLEVCEMNLVFSALNSSPEGAPAASASSPSEHPWVLFSSLPASEHSTVEEEQKTVKFV
jgi:hypothetical protein